MNLQFGLVLVYQLFWILAPTKLLQMVVLTLLDDSSTPLTTLMLGYMMTLLPGRAVILALFIDSAPYAWNLSLCTSLSSIILSTTSLTILAPSAWISFFLGVMTSAPFVNSPTLISALMPPSCPLPPLYQRRHRAYQPNDVLLLDAPFRHLPSEE